MKSYVFPPGDRPIAGVHGSDRVFPVHRIYCVGRNYAAHAREMGADPQREPPFFFSKPADALVTPADGGRQPIPIPYPPRSSNLHHEIELVVAIGRGGSNILAKHAADHVYGFAVGVDFTRRDLQKQAKDKGLPWATAKGFDYSAPMSVIHTVDQTGWLEQAAIWLKVNDEMRQNADIGDMIWSVSEIIAELSTYFQLFPGDLIFTGTPSGVGAVQRGDVLEGGVEGLDSLSIRIE